MRAAACWISRTCVKFLNQVGWRTYTHVCVRNTLRCFGFFFPLLGKDRLDGKVGLNQRGEPGQVREEMKCLAVSAFASS